MNPEHETSPVNDRLPGFGLFWRISWIAVRLVLVYMLVDEFQPFFYQAF